MSGYKPKELALYSTAYGIPNLLRSQSRFNKLFWLIFLLISTCISIWFICESIFGYLEFRVITNIQTVYEQPSRFPTISFCSYTKEYFNKKNLINLIRICNFNFDSSCQFDPESYFEIFYSYYGKCFRFNSGKNAKNNSLPLLNSTIGGLDDSFNLLIDSNEGLVIWFHEADSPPILIDYNNHEGRLLAPSGTYTQIALHKSTETQLEYPYNDCLNDLSKFSFNKTIINYILNKNQSYNLVRCIELCFDLNYIENNNCKCPNAKLGNVWELCWQEIEKKNQTSCTWNYKMNFYSKSIIGKCEKYCPLECSTVSYNVELSTIFTVNENLTKLKVYYQNLKYTSITQEPRMKAAELISEIGGTLGLFIGLSLISFFELIEILIEIIFNLFKKSKI